jgi:hypothetical protein
VSIVDETARCSASGQSHFVVQSREEGAIPSGEVAFGAGGEVLSGCYDEIASDARSTIGEKNRIPAGDQIRPGLKLEKGRAAGVPHHACTSSDHFFAPLSASVTLAFAVSFLHRRV